MTRIQLNLDSKFLTVLARRLQTYYQSKLERYAASHQSIGI